MLGAIAGFCHEGGSLPLLVMFPELEKTFLGLLASAARPDGYIPHDLGIHSFDHATDGTTSPPGWKDLGPTFILLVNRYYKWTKDLQFLRETYPVMVKTLEWDLKQDRDGDGIPDAEGQADAGFDATAIKGKEQPLRLRVRRVPHCPKRNGQPSGVCRGSEEVRAPPEESQRVVS